MDDIDARRGVLDPWRPDIARLAEQGAYGPLSGLRAEQSPDQPAGEMAPYVTHLVATFGARLMWGSDGPVLTRFGERYTRLLDDVERMAGVSRAALKQFFAGCARQFHDLEQEQAA